MTLASDRIRSTLSDAPPPPPELAPAELAAWDALWSAPPPGLDADLAASYVAALADYRAATERANAAAAALAHWEDRIGLGPLARSRSGRSLAALNAALTGADTN